MSRHWKWFLPGYVLALPGTILGLMLVFYYGIGSIRLRSGCIEITIAREHLIGGPWVGAATFGNVIFFRDKRMRALRRLQVHERVHVWQAMVLSWPIFMLAYGIHYAVLLRTVDGTWIDAYRRIWAERMAYSREHKENAWE